MKRDTKTYLLLLSLFVLISCGEKADIRESIRLSGINHYELEKVLCFYQVSPGDSLKLKAARFLIGNMQNKGFIDGGLMDQFRFAFDSIGGRNDLNWENDNRHIVGIVKWAKTVPIETRLSFVEDTKRITAVELIENIEEAFAAWGKAPWSRSYTFEQFCEYVLPYRSTNERLETSWRGQLRSRNVALLGEAIDSGWTSVTTCYKLNQRIKMAFVSNFNECPGDLSFSDMEHTKRGRCVEQCNFAILNMRAIGLPVSLESVPVWANRDFGHYWNSVLDTTGRSIPFSGTEKGPGDYQLVYIPSKIYRKQFSIQRHTPLYIYRQEEYIPPFFFPHDCLDVTDQYDMPLGTLSVRIRSQDPSSRIAYLATFSNDEWYPVAYTAIIGGEVRFENLGCGYIPGSKEEFTDYGKGILYLPIVYIHKTSRYKPISDPYVMYRDGRIRPIKARFTHKETLVVKRKYPRMKNIIINARMMQGGIFDASSDRLFRHPTRLFRLDSLPASHLQTAKLSRPVTCRYVRYTPPADSWKEIGEIQLLDSQGKTIPYRIVSSHLDTTHLGNIHDGNVLSFYNSPPENTKVFIFDMGKVTEIASLAYCPRTDDNDITPGNRYELFVWDDYAWHSLGVRKATDYQLVFREIPTGGLFLVKNLDRGREHRPFTYENGRQVWW